MDFVPSNDNFSPGALQSHQDEDPSLAIQSKSGLGKASEAQEPNRDRDLSPNEEFWTPRTSPYQTPSPPSPLSELGVVHTMDDDVVHVPTTFPVRARVDLGAQSHEVDQTSNDVSQTYAEQESHPSSTDYPFNSASSPSLHPCETAGHANYETRPEEQHVRRFQKLILKGPNPSTRISKLEIHVTKAIALCNATGKPSLGQALDRFFRHSIENPTLLDLFDAILSESATRAQMKDFQQQFRSVEKEIQSPGLKRKRPSQGNEANIVAEASRVGNAVLRDLIIDGNDMTGAIHNPQARALTKGSPQHLTKSQEAVIQKAKSSFIAKWDSRTGHQPDNRAMIERLCRFANLPFQDNRSTQESFSELDKWMELVSCFGSLTVQQETVRELRSWIASENTRLPTYNPPSYLATYKPAKRMVYEQLWIASQILDLRANTKKSNKLLWRITLTKFMMKYEEAIELLQREESIGNRENVRTKKALVGQINHTLFPDYFTTPVDTKWRRPKFHRERNSGRPYLAIQQHFRSDGIVAIMPLHFCESQMNSPERIDFLLEALDVLRPDFHSSSRIRLYSRVLNCMYSGVMPKEADMQLLDRFSQSDPGARRLEELKLQFPDSYSQPKELSMDEKQSAEENKVTFDLDMPKKKKARIDQTPGDNQLMPNGESGSSNTSVYSLRPKKPRNQHRDP
ncbi:MAG: hypothetical protein Q9209_003849 [Squamulea sp. 1 TL-2023]